MPASKINAVKSGIRDTRYRASRAYGLDLEILPASDLRRRVPPEILSIPERIGFHMFIYVSAGHFTHTIDSDLYACEPGTFLTLHPSQVQQYDARSGWDGWLVIFRPEFLFPDEAETPANEQAAFSQLEALPPLMQFDPPEREAIEELIRRMHQDGHLAALRPFMNALLRVQLQSLLMRLDVLHRHHQMVRNSPSGALKRFSDFRGAVAKHYREHHGVHSYADLLHCSEKSLSRATQQMVGVSAKAFIIRFLALEARRLLAHSSLQVSQISEQLGFDEPTNFAKFFLLHVGLTPTQFRAKHGFLPAKVRFAT